MNAALWAAQGLLSLVFMSTGLAKLVKHRRELVMRVPVLAAFRSSTIKGIGLLEVLGAVGVIVPWWLGVEPWLTAAAAVGLGLTMVAGAVAHVVYQGPRGVPVNAVLLALAAFVAWGRWP